VPIETALSHLYARTQVREFAFFAVVMGLNRQTGGNLAETLEILADTVRRRVAMAAKAKALASEARASAAILGALPFVVGLLITAINPGYMRELFTDPRGPNLIMAFVVLLSCGMFTIRWIIKRSSEG
jgi:tight adherence protein B